MKKQYYPLIYRPNNLYDIYCVKKKGKYFLCVTHEVGSDSCVEIFKNLFDAWKKEFPAKREEKPLWEYT